MRNGTLEMCREIFEGAKNLARKSNSDLTKGREPSWLREPGNSHVLKCIFMKAIELDIDIT